MFESVNLLAVLLCGVLHWIIGALWYSPLLFARPWVKYKGIDVTSDDHGPSILMYLAGLVVGIVVAAGLAVLLSLARADTVGAALLVGIVAWTAFTAAPAFANAVFGGSVPLWLIDTGYPLVSVLLMSVILAVW